MESENNTTVEKKPIFANSRSRMIFIGTIIMLLLLMIVAFNMMGSEEAAMPSSVATPEKTNPTPGGNDSPRYRQAVIDENADNADKAEETGGSSVATIVSGEPIPLRDQIPTLDEALAAGDASEPEAPAPQQNRQQQQQQRQQTEVNKAMLAQAKALMKSWSDVPESATINLVSDSPQSANGRNQAGQDLAKVAQREADEGKVEAEPPAYRAGEMIPAVMDTELSSDYPSAVRATIVSGPLKGAYVIGGFQRQLDTVLLTFSQISLEGVGSRPVNMVAVDPNTGNSGLQSEVDRHYLQRYSSLLGSVLVKSLGAYGDLTAQENSQQVLDNNGNLIISRGEIDESDKVIASLGRGASDVSDDFSDEIQEGFRRPPTVRVIQNEPVNLFVLEDIPKNLLAP